MFLGTSLFANERRIFTQSRSHFWMGSFHELPEFQLGDVLASTCENCENTRVPWWKKDLRWFLRISMNIQQFISIFSFKCNYRVQKWHVSLSFFEYIAARWILSPRKGPTFSQNCTWKVHRISLWKVTEKITHQQVSTSLVECQIPLTLLKTNMEPENHLFEKEDHLPNPHFWVPC